MSETEINIKMSIINIDFIPCFCYQILNTTMSYFFLLQSLDESE